MLMEGFPGLVAEEFCKVYKIDRLLIKCHLPMVSVNMMKNPISVREPNQHYRLRMD